MNVIICEILAFHSHEFIAFINYTRMLHLLHPWWLYAIANESFLLLKYVFKRKYIYMHNPPVATKISICVSSFRDYGDLLFVCVLMTIVFKRKRQDAHLRVYSNKYWKRITIKPEFCIWFQVNANTVSKVALYICNIISI